MLSIEESQATYDTPEDIWQKSLDELELQMQRATFNQWLSGSRLIAAEDGQFVVGVQNAYAKQWIEGRLMQIIERTVAAVAGEEINIRVVVGDDEDWSLNNLERVVDQKKKVEDAGISAATAEPPSTNGNGHAPALNGHQKTNDKTVGPGQAYIGVTELDPTRGFIPVSHYAERFWRPYVGLVPFALWQVLRSYGYFVREKKSGWPPLARIIESVGYGDRNTILGRAASAKKAAQEGAIDVLVRERLCHHWTRGAGRGTTHFFDVLDSLPLLAPEQVRQLTAGKRAEHTEFLGYYKGFNIEVWRKSTVPSLVPDNWWKR